MKKLTLTFVFALICSVSFANDKYEKAMLASIDKVYKAGTVEEYKNVINELERIGNAEKDKWEPHYYASFAYTKLASNSKLDDRDNYLDQAQEQLKKAMNLSKDNVELVALQGFIHTLRITVDPPTRGQLYSGLSIQEFQKARQLDPENPRALFLLGQVLYGTAQFMGTDTKDACALIAKSVQQFDQYNADNPLAPKWGKSSAQAAYQQCGR
ncbi:MAG: hypothetical protein AAFX87_23565 [Bacteroidota bacterium]